MQKSTLGSVLTLVAVVAVAYRIKGKIQNSRRAMLKKMLLETHRSYHAQRYIELCDELGRVHARKGGYETWKKEALSALGDQITGDIKQSLEFLAE